MIRRREWGSRGRWRYLPPLYRSVYGFKMKKRIKTPVLLTGRFVYAFVLLTHDSETVFRNEWTVDGTYSSRIQRAKNWGKKTKVPPFNTELSSKHLCNVMSIYWHDWILYDWGLYDWGQGYTTFYKLTCVHSTQRQNYVRRLPLRTLPTDGAYQRE